MKKVKYVFFIITSLSVFNSCDAQSTITMDQLDFMVGTWKIENKATFEEWNKEKDDELQGVSYKLREGSKKITEKILLKKTDSTLIYQATVFSQNNGKTITFILNPYIKDSFSFENLSHDFPKKIQYQKIDRSTMLVRILGKNGKGFSHRMIKQ